jgi:hypothetical protein
MDLDRLKEENAKIKAEVEQVADKVVELLYHKQ